MVENSSGYNNNTVTNRNISNNNKIKLIFSQSIRKKLENDEKINKLIEEIFSIKPFKLYILDKFGNGNKKIFFEKIKKGEINTDELESELNILKEIYDSNNNDIHDKYPMTETKKGEENQNLKKMLENLQKKLGGQGGVMLEDDKKAFLELKEQYEANQKNVK